MKRFSFLSLFCVGLILLWPTSSKGFVRFYTYIKNDTPYTLLTQDNIQVLPHSTTILTSHQLDDPGYRVDGRGVEHYFPSRHPVELVTIEAQIKTQDAVGITPCSLAFETYNRIKIKKETFSTFVFVTEKDKKLVCTPQAVETQGNESIKPGGKVYSFPEAITLADQTRHREPCCLFYPYRALPPLYIVH
jgi:hypothetical protein